MANANDVETEQPLTSGATDHPETPAMAQSTSMPPLPPGFEPIQGGQGQSQGMPPLPAGFVPLNQAAANAPAVPKPASVDMKEVDTTGSVEDAADAFGTGAAGSLAAAGRIGRSIPGIEYVGEKIGDILGLPKLASDGSDPYKKVQANVEKNREGQEGTVAGNAGHFLEGTAEFIAGEAALKGLSLGEKMMEVAKITKILEKYPSLAHAANQAKQIKALMAAGKFARASASAATVGSVQGAAHTAPGEEIEGAKAGALGGAIGGGVGEGLSQTGGAIASTLRKPAGEAVAAAAEDTAPGILRPGIEKVAGESIPVRSSSPVAQTAENLMTNLAKSRLQEFEIGKTQPAVRQTVSKVTADAAKIENAASTATKEDPFGFGGHRDAVQARSKPTFQAIDEATDGEFSKAQKEADLARQSTDFEGKKAYQAALDKQEKLFDYARWKSVNEAGVNPDAQALSEDALAQAKADWKKSVGMDDLKTRFDKFVHPSPAKLVKPGEVDPGYVNPKQFREGITDAIQQGEFKKAGFAPAHIQALEDLGRILDKSQVKFNDTVSNIVKQIMGGSVGGAIGSLFGGGVPGAIAGSVGEYGVGRVLSKIMTSSAAVRALTEGLESEAPASGIASKLMGLWKDESGEMVVPGTKPSVASRAGNAIAGLSDDVIAAGGKKTKEGELTAHGASGVSVEEIARKEKFLRVTPSGLKEYQGVSPDPQSPLRPNEAIIAVKPDGTWRYQDGNPQIAKDVADRAIKSWKGPKAEGNEITAIADRFNKANGRPPIKHEKLTPDSRRADIADALDAMKHNPEDPKVKTAYKALVDESKAQMKLLESKGYKFERSAKDPYKSYEEMRDDVKNNKHLSVWTGGNPLSEDHPLGKIDKETGWRKNDIMRGVHDVMGHVAGDNDFSEAGEENAYNLHKQVFSGKALPALTTETKGQTSWFFNNKNVRAGKPLGEFPEQKAGILPDHFYSTDAVNNIASLTNKNGGATYNPVQGDLSGTDAYAVPMHRELSRTIEGEKITPEQIKKYMDLPEVKAALAADPKLSIGTWVNDGKTYLDLSAAVKDRGEAIRLGKENGQKAITYLKNFEDIPVGGAGTGTSLESVRVGQRKPTAVAAEKGHNPSSNLGPDVLDRVLTENPKYGEKLANKLSSYDALKLMPEGAEESFDPEAMAAIHPNETIKQATKQMADNIVAMHNAMPKSMREMSKKWYDSANKMTQAQAQEFGVSHPQAAAVTAVLSPQNPWDNNISLARRVMDVWKNKQNFKWSPEMNRKAAELYGQSDAIAKFTDMVRGKTLSKLKDEDPDVELAMKAMWTRIYDEAHNPSTFERWAPDGTTRGIARNANRAPAKSAWFSLDPITKALSILQDGSMDNINERLGNAHKVRNFYNNIVDPNAKMGDTTVDTHGVGVAHFSPFGLDDPEVVDNFKGLSNAAHGLKGTYPVYHEAYRQAAERLGMLPRQLQSITWEGIRSLFKDKSPEVRSAVRAIWKEHQDGDITVTEARKRIIKAAGGFKPAEWESDYSPNETAGAPADSTELSRTGVSQEKPQANGGTGSRAARAVPATGAARAEAENVYKLVKSMGK